jgi:transcription elongation factor Elf1
MTMTVTCRKCGKTFEATVEEPESHAKGIPDKKTVIVHCSYCGASNSVTIN